MLKGNLSTRPFYNERLVSVVLGLIAVVAVGLTVYNVTELRRLSSERSRIAGESNADEQAALRVTTQAATMQQQVDRGTMTVLAAQTREANSLIAQRTFSWTTLFSQIEKVIPYDVHLVSVAPKIERGGNTRIIMSVVAKRPEDLQAFTNALSKTVSFYDVAPHAQQLNDDGTIGASVEMLYLPPETPKVEKGANAKTGKGQS